MRGCCCLLAAYARREAPTKGQHADLVDLRVGDLADGLDLESALLGLLASLGGPSSTRAVNRGAKEWTGDDVKALAIDLLAALPTKDRADGLVGLLEKRFAQGRA